MTLLRIEGLSKHFAGVPVLTDVHLEIGSGQIVGLVGQNGSGKSTLIKCLAGFHQPDPGWRLAVGGETLTRPLNPGEPARLGISFVHQDLSLVGDLSVLENLRLNSLGRDRRWYIPWRAEQRRAHELLESFGLDLDPRVKLGTLRPIEQAQVAIIRAVLQLRETKAEGVLVLDEATTFLDRTGRDSLYTLLRSIAASGNGVLFVSHDIGEVLDLTDRVTVLRDGRVVDDAPTAERSEEDIVGLIVGGARTVPAETTARAVDKKEHLAVEGLDGEHVHDIAFDADAGEIVGITGIVGSGWEFVLEHLYGATTADGGVLRLGSGKPVPLARMTPVKALGMGMVLVPSSRLTQGIIGDLSLRDNVMLPVVGDFFRGARLRLGRLTEACAGLLRDHAVNPPAPARPIGTLSGGNQQKAVLGKWLQLGPSLVLLSEPTQGVDVGARQLIFRVIREAAAAGAVVLYASGDWDEISRLADRVVVIADGRVTATFDGSVSVEQIAGAAYRGTRRSADLARAVEDFS